MAVDLFGPADAGAARAVTTRPADLCDGVTQDSWFQACVGGPGTGTPITERWLNRVTDALRRLVRRNGVDESNADGDILAKAVRSQSLNFVPAAQVAGAANAITLAPTLPVASYNDGLVLRFVAQASNTGPTTLNVSGVGAVAVTRENGAALTGGEIVAGTLCQVMAVGGTWRLSVVAKGRLMAHRVITTSGAYTPTPGATYLVVEVIGGGGGGAGSGGQGAGTYSLGGGGGGGGWSKALIPAQPATITIGAGGVGGNTAPTGGGNGGTTTFAGATDAVSALGGNGGPVNNGMSPPVVTASGGGANLGAGGNLEMRQGGAGLPGAATAGGYYGGGGGPSGSGSPGGSPPGTNTAGFSPSGYGGGGSGACTAPNSPGLSGAAGATGAVIILEYA